METLLLIAVIVLLVFGILDSVFLLSRALNDFQANLPTASPQMSFDIEGLRGDLIEMGQDTIGQMQPPNAMDHLLGMLSQFAQMKMAQKFGVNPAEMLEGFSERLNDPPE